MLVEIADRDVGALARKKHRDRPPDAGVAAGDERDLVEKLVGALVVGRLVHRCRIELGFQSGFPQMLLRQRRRRIFPHSRLHGLSGPAMLPCFSSFRSMTC